MAHIALLRGINLGAARRVPMPKLREALDSAGYRAVRTQGQSGNVVLDSVLEPAVLERDLATLLTHAFGLVIPVIVRTRDELASVIERNPLAAVVDDPKRYQVSFLRTHAPAAAVHMLTTADVAPERVIIIGREIYAWHPHGITHSPLAGLLTEKRLGVQVTARNWLTLTKLLALADELTVRAPRESGRT